MKISFLIYPAISTNLLTIVRIFVGILIMKHGIALFDAVAMDGVASMFEGMNIPLPALMAHVCKSAEFFGGLLLAVGFLTHAVSAVLTFNMLVAEGAHGFHILAEGEFAFLYLLLFVVFAIFGGGKYSIDSLVFKQK